MTLLEVRNLKTYFHTDKGVVRAVDGIDLTVEQGKTEGLVGESGCGKSITALSIMQLVPALGKIMEGEIIFEGENLLRKNPREMSRIRGSKISMIFQEHLSSLNPVLQIGRQIEEAILLHQGLDRHAARKRVLKMLELVGISSPETRIKDYPHQLSGGMRQRVMIAMALCCNPALLIADEPTTALDVTIQAQILELLKGLIKKFHTSLLLITHDFGVVAEVCDRVSVMYAGKIVERAPTRALFKDPRHPYTRGLLHAIPRVDGTLERLEGINGVVPSLDNLPAGCPFVSRCPGHAAVCHHENPDPVKVAPGHVVYCWMHGQEGVANV